MIESLHEHEKVWKHYVMDTKAQRKVK